MVEQFPTLFLDPRLFDDIVVRELLTDSNGRMARLKSGCADDKAIPQSSLTDWIARRFRRLDRDYIFQ